MKMIKRKDSEKIDFREWGFIRDCKQYFKILLKELASIVNYELEQNTTFEMWSTQGNCVLKLGLTSGDFYMLEVNAYDVIEELINDELYDNGGTFDDLIVMKQNLQKLIKKIDER
jgi:hypothetical protein